MLRKLNYLYNDEPLDVPSHLNFGKYMVEALWSYNDTVALINARTHEKLTYRKLVRDAMNLAISLTSMGVKNGDTVVISSENRREFFSTVIGIICTGAAVTAVNPASTKGELEHLLSMSKPKMIFSSPASYKSHKTTLVTLPYLKTIVLYGNENPNDTVMYEDLIKSESGKNDVTLNTFEIVDVIGQTDTAMILYSSGTTGLPKGVMLTHLNLLTTCKLPDSMDPTKTGLTISPWYHTMGLMGTLKYFSSGMTMLYLPKFDAEFYMQTIEKYKISQIVVPPPVLIAICKSVANYDVSSIQLVYSGAAPLRDDTIRSAKVRFPNLVAVLQGYGMTECTLTATKDTYRDVFRTKVGSVGRVLAGTVLKIVDVETRKVLGRNQSGEICIKGPTIMKGYINKDRRDDFDEEGFYKTGDIGYYDEDRCLFIVDRLKELIKYKGYQVAPAEIEGILLQHHAVRDAGVVGIAHESGGEVPCAFIALQSGCDATEQEIKDYVAEKLSNPKHIRGGVRFVSDIPKNPSGKILRKRLREMVKSQSKL